MIIDAHVHLFPHRLAEAVRVWFETNAWSFVHKQGVAECVQTLREGGIHRMVALPYAHKPGMARALNDFTRAVALEHPEVVPCCTVFPGEEDEEAILDEALGLDGFAGVKIHCHVMKLAADDPRLDPVWRASAKYRKPVVVHAGREPASPAYGLDVHTISGAHRVRRVLERHPDAVLIVPHLGGDEYGAFEALLTEFPNLHLDTAMVLARFFPDHPDAGLLARHPDRILYGTDYPRLPYEWDRELRFIRSLGLAPEDEAKILGGNAQRLFGISDA